MTDENREYKTDDELTTFNANDFGNASFYHSVFIYLFIYYCFLRGLVKSKVKTFF